MASAPDLLPLSLQQNHLLRWFSVVAANYYSGRPLGYDAQQAQAAPQAPPQPQPPQDAGEQANNHTHVHGVPGADPSFCSPNFSLVLLLQNPV